MTGKASCCEYDFFWQNITATDLEVGVRGEIEGAVARDGTVTVNAKKLYEIIREAPADQVQLKRLENEWVEDFVPVGGYCNCDCRHIGNNSSGLNLYEGV
jgi:hypothetical protein